MRHAPPIRVYPSPFEFGTDRRIFAQFAPMFYGKFRVLAVDSESAARQTSCPESIYGGIACKKYETRYIWRSSAFSLFRQRFCCCPDRRISRLKSPHPPKPPFSRKPMPSLARRQRLSRSDTYPNLNRPLRPIPGIAPTSSQARSWHRRCRGPQRRFQPIVLKS